MDTSKARKERWSAVNGEVLALTFLIDWPSKDSLRWRLLSKHLKKIRGEGMWISGKSAFLEEETTSAKVLRL